MKIAVVGHLKFPIAKPFAGGLETFTYGFVEELVQRGHDVRLFASGDSDPELRLSPIIERATIPDSKQRFGVQDDEWIERNEDTAYRCLMKRLANSEFDVIHNHSLSPVPLTHAASLNCPLVTTLHAPPLPRMAEALRIHSSSHCGHFVNISQANANAWRSVLPEQEIVHNGVDTAFWKNCCEGKVHRAVWFGRILPDKGTHFAIEAAHRAGLPIDVVGPISDEDYFAERVAPLLRSPDQYLGHRTHQELCKIISRSAVAIITPCWDEPFGLVVAEALACGTPVAGFARGALPEIIRPSVGRLAKPGHVGGLAVGIRRCFELNSEVCRRYAQERFSIDRMIDDYQSLYRSLIASPTSYAAASDKHGLANAPAA